MGGAHGQEPSGAPQAVCTHTASCCLCDSVQEPRWPFLHPAFTYRNLGKEGAQPAPAADPFHHTLLFSCNSL